MPDSTELVIARHGEAMCNVHGTVGGDKGCTGLTERGHHQAARLATRLAAEHDQRPFHTVYSSPRLRVRQTADAVTGLMKMPYTVVNDLRGPDHGDADGLPWSQVKEVFGSAMQHQPATPIAPGGDSWNSYLSRATTTIEKLIQRHTGQRILIIGHGETIEAAHTLLLGLPTGASIRVWFSTAHTSVARWRLQINRHGRATWLLDAHNDTSHLAEQPS
ncbi:histidine phosphatase family protein [Catellatospora coxensis]|uniref:Phosphoglycerate mutase n=1 Tax=Catellatospora coxensis TaxID=310354 RepID=A0A8J3KUZ6_9ACTN|nr:histidine phosphatase family protein [Catellatospora coxensis]GIG03666.1 phosphoglycerate mutase [Catellatospora coxensis]